MELPLESRAAAAQGLAFALQHFAMRQDVLVLAISTGGLAVAHGMASKLQVGLDLMLTAALRSPDQEDLIIGALSGSGARILHSDVIASRHLDQATIEHLSRQAGKELARAQHACRGDRPRAEIAGRHVLLVDDGAASLDLLDRAVTLLRAMNPAELVVALPVASPQSLAALRVAADDVVCLATPDPFITVSHWYKHFPDVTEQEARELLADVAA